MYFGKILNDIFWIVNSQTFPNVNTMLFATLQIHLDFDQISTFVIKKTFYVQNFAYNIFESCIQ